MVRSERTSLRQSQGYRTGRRDCEEFGCLEVFMGRVACLELRQRGAFDTATRFAAGT